MNSLFDLDEFTEGRTPQPESVSNRIGDIAEEAFCFQATKEGFSVFRPNGHAQQVDLCIALPNKPALRVQVKTCRTKPNGSLTFALGRSKPSYRDSYDNGTHFERYHPDAFDVIAAFDPYTERFSLYLWADIYGKQTKVFMRDSVTWGNWSDLRK